MTWSTMSESAHGQDEDWELLIGFGNIEGLGDLGKTVSQGWWAWKPDQSGIKKREGKNLR